MNRWIDLDELRMRGRRFARRAATGEADRVEPSVAGEISIDDGALITAIGGGVLPSSPLRSQLVSPERLAAAATAVSSVRDPLEAWRRLGGTEMSAGAEGVQRLFHVRRRSTIGLPDRLARDMRAGALRIALCPSPGVPPAPCIAFPPSVRDAIVFSLLRPALGRTETLLVSAVRAIDAIGRCTAALSCTDPLEVPRWLAWRTVAPARLDIVCRATLLLVVHLLEQHGWRRWLRAQGATTPDRPYCEWPQQCVIAAGALAWRRAVEAGLRVAATADRCSDRFYVWPEAAGRRYAELDNPFEPLLQLRCLGFVLHGYSTSAISAGFRLPPPISCGSRARALARCPPPPLRSA